MNKLKIVLSGLFKYKNLLYELVIRDIKIRYRRSVLGLLWTLLNPVLMMTVMTIVFSHLFRFDIENFPVYFFTANILFAFNSEATTNCLYGITGNASLIKKIYIPKYLFPVSKVFSSVVNLLFAFIAMIIVMIATGAPFYSTMILTPVIMFYVILFTLGLGLILSVAVVFFRDVAHLYNVVTMAWMYLTPIFYPVSLLQEKMSLALTLNPMYHFIEYFRSIVLYNQIPTLSQNITCLLIGMITLTIGLIFFYKNQDKFILYI
ncbi:ABC transporter permease [Clostridium cagae]|uniref:ABC transporter permease n=1 Tax=Clostridium cagae TaxID=2080751 RepID=UPI003F772C82